MQLVTLTLSDIGVSLGQMLFCLVRLLIDSLTPQVGNPLCTIAFMILRRSRLLSALMESHIAVGLVLMLATGGRCKRCLKWCVLLIWLIALIMGVIMSFDLQTRFTRSHPIWSCTWIGKDVFTLIFVVSSFTISVCCYLVIAYWAARFSTVEPCIWGLVALYPLSFAICFLPVLWEYAYILNKENDLLHPGPFALIVGLSQDLSGFIHVAVYGAVRTKLSKFQRELSAHQREASLYERAGRRPSGQVANSASWPNERALASFPGAPSSAPTSLTSRTWLGSYLSYKVDDDSPQCSELIVAERYIAPSSSSSEALSGASLPSRIY